MPTNPKPSDAFTLLELMLVAAVIAILAALLLPVLSGVRARGDSTVCKNHLRLMGQALQMYVQEHASTYPNLRGIVAVGAAPETAWWWAKLQPYYPLNWTNRAYHCPGYKGENTGQVDHHDPLGSYAYNARGVQAPFGYEDPARGINYHPAPKALGLGRVRYSWPTVPATRETPEQTVKVPAEMFAIGESRFHSAKINGLPGGQCDMFCGWLHWSNTPAAPAGSGNQRHAFDPRRHGRNYNQLFCDGHVAAFDPWILFNPTNTAPLWNNDHQPHPESWIPE